ncbi:hypothetical protein C815_01544 [Firmicutes bacterium M10-2]|nr:hypothetical protein C815_01544 [Firmicutes bacterium M10-2]
MEIFLIVLILFGLFMFAFYMLPLLVPFLIIVAVIGAIRRALSKNKQEDEFIRFYESNEDTKQPQVNTREKRPDAIDVEYIEYEEKSEDPQ